jgi:hypothetical protein
MLGREIVERQQGLAVFDQAGNGLLVLGAIFPGEGVHCGLGSGAGVGLPYLPQVGLHRRLHGFGDLVQDISDLVNQQRW